MWSDGLQLGGSDSGTEGDVGNTRSLGTVLDNDTRRTSTRDSLGTAPNNDSRVSLVTAIDYDDAGSFRSVLGVDMEPKEEAAASTSARGESALEREGSLIRAFGEAVVEVPPPVGHEGEALVQASEAVIEVPSSVEHGGMASSPASGQAGLPRVGIQHLQSPLRMALGETPVPSPACASSMKDEHQGGSLAQAATGEAPIPSPIHASSIKDERQGESLNQAAIREAPIPSPIRASSIKDERQCESLNQAAIREIPVPSPIRLSPMAPPSVVVIRRHADRNVEFCVGGSLRKSSNNK
ncbi:hypothetical protein T492DRAFT_845870 [Pavlovales sp. CCMP2436]|nr:hypothetical protein T492DRAFT_845870 [Pavlovales sp. CCMP2436]